MTEWARESRIGLQEQRWSQLLHPYSETPFIRAHACMRAYVRACVRALALRAKRRLNARRIGRPDRYEIATYAERKGEKDGE